jgi:hypothetical protein
MDKKTYLTKVYDKLQQDGFELKADKISGLDVSVAINKKFKLAWMATQMNIFVIVGSSDRIVRDDIEIFSKNSLEYAIKNNQGLPRGVQSGVVSFSLLTSPNIDEDAKQWAKERPKKHFAAFEYPVLFDLTHNQIFYYNKTPVFGGIYYKFFRNFIEKYLKVLERTCSGCGRAIPTDAKICPYCGRKF